ncbi:CD99 antigen [Pithys albifrons albifrons]|uniref:CD99 antigen n=1 Tax=Pithys albifrons albifrons TaxID=3385563 RepID=UPI003A5CCBCF
MLKNRKSNERECLGEERAVVPKCAPVLLKSVARVSGPLPPLGASLRGSGQARAASRSPAPSPSRRIRERSAQPTRKLRFLGSSRQCPGLSHGRGWSSVPRDDRARPGSAAAPGRVAGGAAAPGAAQGGARRLSGHGWSVCVCVFVGRAAMRRWRLLLFPVLLAVLVPVRGNVDDFSLEDALEKPKTTKKPFLSQKTPPPDLDDFNLDDALHPEGPKPDLPANPRDTDKPKKDQPKDTGGTFEDADLFDGDLPKGGSDGSGSNDRRGQTPNNGQEDEASQGAIAGIVSAVAATVIGAVSSFIAYQKKKLCFKQSDEENVNMDSHRGAQSEPPVQRTLLEN